jgi:hypothetical protein
MMRPRLASLCENSAGKRRGRLQPGISCWWQGAGLKPASTKNTAVQSFHTNSCGPCWQVEALLRQAGSVSEHLTQLEERLVMSRITPTGSDERRTQDSDDRDARYGVIGQAGGLIAVRLADFISSGEI